MRYRFYRVHKYVTYMLYDFERLCAQTDFSDNTAVDQLQQALDNLAQLMHSHAEHEDNAIHALLRAKNVHIQDDIELDHQNHIAQFAALTQQLEQILASEEANEKIALGYDFYVDYRLFVAENVYHIHQEETVIMPELQKWYTDEELKQLSANTYGHMTAEQMIHMMQVLFPHMDINDKQSFLQDIYDAQPEKFTVAWERVAPMLSEHERQSIPHSLGLMA